MVDEYLKRYANHIEEQNRKGNFNTPEIIASALRSSRTATRKDFADFKEAFKDYDHGLGSWKKWGGGNKMGSGGAAVNAARRARADGRKSAPDANVNNYTNKNLADRLGLTALSNFVDSRVNDVQGKFMPSNPSFGFSQQTLNAANDGEGARGADSSFAGEAGRNVYGGDMRSSYGNDSSSSSGSNFLTSFLNNLSFFRENPIEIASHDKPFSRYPAAGGPDKWPGMPSDAIKRYVHPSTNPITFFANPYRV